MSNKYIIADLHLGDSSVAKYRGVSVEENFNKVLSAFLKFKKNDTVIIVGDLGSSLGYLEKFVEEVKCKLVVVAGNHDNANLVKFLVDKGIPVVSSLTMYHYIVTHIPINSLEVANFSGNVHGHIHSGTKLKGNYINVCIDVIGYDPIPFNRRFSGVKTKKFVYVNQKKSRKR